ncbi:MAG: hypothetical protein P8130_11245 [Deltaproteobacteria bacterium]
MAVHALGEFLVNCVTMRKTVAVLTFWNGRMLAFMAVNTSQLAMFGGGFTQIIGNISVAGTTEGNRRIFGRHNVERFMGVMAGNTIGGFLALFMGFMAFRAIGDPTVNVMTEGAGLFGMFAFIFGYPLDFLFMTGAAFGLGVLRQLKRSDGHMGVGMAAKTIFKCEMGSF